MTSAKWKEKQDDFQMQKKNEKEDFGSWCIQQFLKEFS